MYIPRGMGRRRQFCIYYCHCLYTKDLKKELERGPGTGAEGNVNVSVGPTRHSPAMAKKEKEKEEKEEDFVVVPFAIVYPL